MPARVLVVDDMPLISEMVARICTKALGYEIAGCCGSGEEAWRLIQETNPDLVILDLRLNGNDGFWVSRQIDREKPGVPYVFMSAHCTEYVVTHAGRSRSLGFIDKNLSGVDEFVHALRTVVAGNRYFSIQYQETQRGIWQNPFAYSKILTDREEEILGLIGCSLSDAEIARHLGITVSTAETHRRNLLIKIKAGSTPKLIRYAAACGLVQFAAATLSSSTDWIG